MTRRVLLLQAGDAPAPVQTAAGGNVPDWFRRALGAQGAQVDVLRVFEGETVPQDWKNRYAVGVISGSWAMVTDRAPWSEAVAGWIREAVASDFPLLGVCYGHQLMAHALGGEVADHPEGIEIGTRTVSLLPGASADPMLSHLPASFPAQLTHYQSVRRMPAGAVRLAESDHDAHQIIRYGERAMSSQFHPEMTVVELGAIIGVRREALQGQGLDVVGLENALQDTPQARSLLTQFVGRYLDSSRG